MVEGPKIGDPRFIGPFRVLARLGRGGFGTVYAASRPERPGELVAVKVIHPNLSDALEFRSRFAREIDAIKRVHSDFVPRLIDERSADEPAWLATELIPGLSLNKVVAQCGPLPETAVWHLGASIAEALAAIHDARLVHRDLKPQNVLLVPDRPWIIDFGLVRLSDLPHQSSSRLPMATYQYAAPEQLSMGLLGAGVPADVFALGATLLFAVTGHPPHEADTMEALFFLAREGKPNLTGLPRGLSGMVGNCLLRSPEARPTLAAVRAEIARHTVGRSSNDGFADALPRDVVALLDAYREELAGLLQARGPSRLGWQAPSFSEPYRDSGYETLPALPGVEPLSSAGSTMWPQTDPQLADSMADRPGPFDHFEPLAQEHRADVRAVDSRQAPTVLKRDGGLGDVAGPTVPWTRPFDSWICAPVVVSGGVCVVTCRDGTVEGLRAGDGTRLWPPVRLREGISGAAVVMPQGSAAGGDAFVAATDGSVHAIGLSSGQHRLVLEPGSSIEGLPVAVRDPLGVKHRVYVIRADGSLYSINPHTYQPTLVLRIDDGATGALTATTDTVFAADVAGSVHVIDVVTRRVVRQVPTAGLVFGAPVHVHGRLYIAGTDGKLREVDVEDGHEGAPVDLGGAPVHAPAAYDQGRLYIGGSDGMVHGYDLGLSSGHELSRCWRPCALGDEIIGLAASDGMVYVAAGYRVVELDGGTGQPRRELLKLKCLVGATPVISGSFVYIVGLGGVVNCVAMRLYTPSRIPQANNYE
jgi:serine/threonine protein kinase